MPWNHSFHTDNYPVNSVMPIEITQETRQDAIHDLSEDHQEVYHILNDADTDIHAGHVRDRAEPRGAGGLKSVKQQMEELRDLGHLTLTEGFGYMEANDPNDVLTYRVVIRK